MYCFGINAIWKSPPPVLPLVLELPSDGIRLLALSFLRLAFLTLTDTVPAHTSLEFWRYYDCDFFSFFSFFLFWRYLPMEELFSELFLLCPFSSASVWFVSCQFRFLLQAFANVYCFRSHSHAGQWGKGAVAPVCVPGVSAVFRSRRQFRCPPPNKGTPCCWLACGVLLWLCYSGSTDFEEGTLLLTVHSALFLFMERHVLQQEYALRHPLCRLYACTHTRTHTHTHTRNVSRQLCLHALTLAGYRMHGCI